MVLLQIWQCSTVADDYHANTFLLRPLQRQRPLHVKQDTGARNTRVRVLVAVCCHTLTAYMPMSGLPVS